MLSIIKRGWYFINAFILVYFIYEISVLLLNIGLDSISSNLFFLILGLYLCIPALKYNKIKKEIVFSDVECCSKIRKQLKGLEDEGTALQGVTLKLKDNIETIDDIVITRKGLFNIVECSHIGKIEVVDDGNWYKKRGKNKDLVVSPIIQIRRNRDVLKGVLEEDQIIDLIIMVSDRVDIEGEEESTVPIIRYDEINSYIINYEAKDEYIEEDLYQKIYPLINGEKELDKIDENYNIVLDNRWQFRSRFLFTSIFLVLYIINVLKVYK